MTDSYQTALGALHSLRLLELGAAADMLWVHFGGPHTIPDEFRGGTREVGQWALHLQCPWRIVRDGRMVTGSKDFYYAAANGKELHYTSDEKRLFHMKAAALNESLRSHPVTVSDIRCTGAGAFEITMSDGLLLAVMPNKSPEIYDEYSESWRMFEVITDDPHFIYPDSDRNSGVKEGGGMSATDFMDSTTRGDWGDHWRRAREYDDDYPTCVETHAKLRFCHSDASPEAVTAALGIQPTKTQVKGVNLINGREVTRRYSGWFLSSKGEVESKDARRHIDWILDRIRGLEASIEELDCDGWEADVICYWAGIGHGGPMLDPPQMADLAKLNLTCGFDVCQDDGTGEDGPPVSPDHELISAEWCV